MHAEETLVRPYAPPPDALRISAVFPPEVLEQVRGRVRLLALLILVAFAFDLVVYIGHWAAIVAGYPPPDNFFETGAFQAINLAAVVASAGLWWVARSRQVSASRLHTLGLAYEIAICFIIAMLTFWQYYIVHQMLPNLTWVPAVVILFPLILPGPPRRMLAAAVAAGGMSPLALFLLNLTGKVTADPDAYFQTAVHSGIAVGFAYTGARIVYGLGREVTAARELGSYRLVERLGQGGMGEVWRAEHRMLARSAAIKLIRPSMTREARPEASEDARRRFEREAQVIAHLRSPHTIELYDFGIAVDGAFYYVMELLDGFDVETLVRRFGPVPVERAIHFLRQVCHSLSEAESRGLVHRDIKPANIFVCRYGEDCDFVKVLDFGIAKTAAMSAETGPALTQLNTIHGTPAFIAPEQALGRSDLDGRADIYATGCVAYWLLTGQLVFDAETPMALLLHHANTPPTPPSARTELSIPTALDQLVLSCLAKDPAERPQSARELSRRLAEIQSVGIWTENHARTWWATHQPAERTPPGHGATRASADGRPNAADRWDRTRTNLAL
jgi:tRNA A-37 threonylcarbamoyl transferase component Bud32